MSANKLTKPPRRGSVTREGLLDAALTLFLERGFAATRVDDIAQRAGVSKGAVYLHFGTKDEIFQAVIDEGVVARLAQAEQLVADFKGTATELLTAMLNNNLLEYWGSPSSGIPKLIIAESQKFPELAASYHQRITLRARRLIASILQLGIDNGEYRSIDTPYVARCILYSIDHAVISEHSGDPAEADELDPQRFVATLLDLIAHGVAQSDKHA